MESPDEGRSGTRGWHSFSGSPWRRVPFVVGSWATKHRVSRVPLSFFPGFFPHHPVSRGHSHFATLSRNPSNVKGADIRAKGREQRRNRAQANCRSFQHRLGWKCTRHNGTGEVGVATEKKGLLLSAHWPWCYSRQSVSLICRDCRSGMKRYGDTMTTFPREKQLVTRWIRTSSCHELIRFVDASWQTDLGKCASLAVQKSSLGIFQWETLGHDVWTPVRSKISTLRSECTIADISNIYGHTLP